MGRNPLRGEAHDFSRGYITTAVSANICSIDPIDVVEQVPVSDLFDEIFKHIFDNDGESYQKPTNRFVRRWTVEATL